MSEKRIIRVGDVMGSKLYTIDRLATVAEAMALLKQYEVSSLAVNRRDDDDEFGLLVVADIAREVIAKKPRTRARQRVRNHVKTSVDPAVGHARPLRSELARAL